MTTGAICSCTTCGDQAARMRIRHVDPERGLALCEAADGQRRTVELALVAPATVGDVVLVHADVAIARLESEPREEPEEVIG